MRGRQGHHSEWPLMHTCEMLSYTLPELLVHRACFYLNNWKYKHSKRMMIIELIQYNSHHVSHISYIVRNSNVCLQWQCNDNYMVIYIKYWLKCIIIKTKQVGRKDKNLLTHESEIALQWCVWECFRSGFESFSVVRMRAFHLCVWNVNLNNVPYSPCQKLYIWNIKYTNVQKHHNASHYI